MSDDYRQRMLAITDELRAQRVGPYTSAPPIYRLAWMLVWALVPRVNLVAVRVTGAEEWAGTGAIPVNEVLNRAAVTCAILLSLGRGVTEWLR